MSRSLRHVGLETRDTNIIPGAGALARDRRPKCAAFACLEAPARDGRCERHAARAEAERASSRSAER